MSDVMVVDIHNHWIPPEVIAAARAGKFDGVAVEEVDGRPAVSVGRRQLGPFAPAYLDLDLRVPDMDRMGVKVQALSITPLLLGYQLPAPVGIRLCQLANDAQARAVSSRPDRFVALGCVPLQAPLEAAHELRRAIVERGLRGVQIGATVDGAGLGEEPLFPFWEAVAELGAFVFVHPSPGGVAPLPQLGRYHLANVIGNPLETSMAIASLVFGGCLDRWPGLKICLAHAGGFVPYQIGRFDHAYEVRPEARQAIPRPPSTYFRQLFFDTITHSGDALAFLIGKVGASQVMLGTDYPADMADATPLETVAELDLDPAEEELIVGGTAGRLLKVSGERFAAVR